MRKILMRGGMTPFDNFSPEVVISNDSIGSNSGNLLYSYGVYRTLMTEDTVIDMDYYGVERRYTDEDIARINEEYDAYVCPLADAFRNNFEKKLKKYTYFFNKLTIPCYVVGVGLRAPYEPEIGTPRPFDDTAKKFVESVLNKSSIIGLRGEITGEYMNYLGFRDGIDYMPIGCPSMYSLGGSLPQRTLHLSKSSKIAFNRYSIAPENITRFVSREMQVYDNHYLIEQDLGELRLLYYGTQLKPNNDVSALLPHDISHPLFQKDRYRFFVNVPTWTNFLQNIDFSIGSRFHGNVAAVIAGCPTLFIPWDSRTREFVSYHALPSVPSSQLREEDRIEDLVERVDLTSHLKVHHENFERFIQFLDKNNLEHIFKGDTNRLEAPLDQEIRQIAYQEVRPILHCSIEEAVHRISSDNEKKEEKIRELKDQLASQTKQLKSTTKQLKSTTKQLQDLKNSRSYRLGRILLYLPRKIRDLFRRIAHRADEWHG